MKKLLLIVLLAASCFSDPLQDYAYQSIMDELAIQSYKERVNYLRNSGFDNLGDLLREENKYSPIEPSYQHDSYLGDLEHELKEKFKKIVK
jgi:hypothetical protein